MPETTIISTYAAMASIASTITGSVPLFYLLLSTGEARGVRMDSRVLTPCQRSDFNYLDWLAPAPAPSHLIPLFQPPKPPVRPGHPLFAEGEDAAATTVLPRIHLNQHADGTQVLTARRAARSSSAAPPRRRWAARA